MSQSVDNIKKFPVNILEPKEFQSLSLYAEDFLAGDSYDDCLSFADFISELLAKQGQSLAQQNPELYAKYEQIWAQLVFKGFPALPDLDQQSLFQTKILFLIQRNVATEGLLKKFQDFGYDTGSMQAAAKNLLKALANNTETLGDQPIISDGKKIFPQVKNWIYDYSRFPSSVAKRGSLERLNYVNKSQNARPLTQAQRNQLLEILKVYDDLLSSDSAVRGTILSYDDKTGVVTSSRAAEASAPVPQPSASQVQMRRQSFQAEQLPRPAQPQRQGIDIQQKLQDLKERAEK